MELLRQILGLPPGRAESKRLVQHVIDLNARKQSLLDAGDYAAALRIEEECISILKRLWLVHDVGRAYNNAGRMCERLGQWRRSLLFFRKGLKTWKRIGENRGQAVARAGIGRVLMEVDEVDRATEELELARKLFQKDQDYEGEAHVLQLLVDAYDRLTLPDVECTTAQDLLQVCRSLPDKELEARALHLLGIAERKVDRLDASLSNLTQAKSAYEQLKKEEECATVLEDIAATYSAKELYGEACEVLKEGLQFWTQRHDRAHESLIHNRLGTMLARVGDYRQAEQHYDKALSLTHFLSVEKRAQAEGTIFYNLADLCLRQQQYEAATDYADRAEQIFSATHDYPASLMVLKLMTRIRQEQEAP